MAKDNTCYFWICVFILTTIPLYMCLSIEPSDSSMHYYCEEHVVKDITFTMRSEMRFNTLYDITIETGEVLITRDKSLNVGSKYKMKIYRYCDDNMLDDEGNLAIRHISEVICVGNGD